MAMLAKCSQKLFVSSGTEASHYLFLNRLFAIILHCFIPSVFPIFFLIFLPILLSPLMYFGERQLSLRTICFQWTTRFFSLSLTVSSFSFSLSLRLFSVVRVLWEFMLERGLSASGLKKTMNIIFFPRLLFSPLYIECIFHSFFLVCA